MSKRISLQVRIDAYLAERRRLGFALHSRDTLLASFARYVASRHHRGPLTVELMGDWARCDKGNRGTPGTWARRLALLRHFARYLKQFEPDTEVPDELIFGPEPGRVAPHIYHEEEIVELLAAARKLGPRGSLRPMTFETLFGLMASTGLRVSEAIHLRDTDVDLKRGMLTVRQTKFTKSRLLPLHPSTVEGVVCCRGQKNRWVWSRRWRATGANAPGMFRRRPIPHSSSAAVASDWGSRSAPGRPTGCSMHCVTTSVGSIAERMKRHGFMTCAIPLPSGA
jgi:hypothetical protein